MKLKCLIIDDDRTQRVLMESYINETHELELIESFDSAIGAKNFIQSNVIDLIFLDIEMPVMNGFDFLKSIKNPPKVVLISSKEKYALESYDYNVVDYLLKPVAYVNLIQAVDKVKEALNNQTNTNISQEEIFVKVNSVIEKVKLKDILYIAAAVDYVEIYTASKKLLVNTSMAKILEMLPQEKFMRVHRSHIINLGKIDQIDGNIVIVGEQSIRISKSYKEDLLNKINVL